MAEAGKVRARGRDDGKKARKAPLLSRNRPPEGMDLQAWQVALRRQFGARQNFALENLGEREFLSDFLVRNPSSGGAYTVTIRGPGLGMNRCTCGDFRSNELGTCKHIEFVLDRLQRKRGAASMLKVAYRPRYSEIWVSYGARREIRLRLAKEAPTGLRQALLQRVARSADVRESTFPLDVTALSELEGWLAQARAAGHSLRISHDVHAMVGERAAARALASVLDSSYPRGAADPGLGDLLQLPALPYQLEGIWFAARAGRVLIADDMGLGKTVQAIGTVRLWQRHAALKRVLIVCPTSLKHQWARELQRFAAIEAQVIEGPPAERARQMANPLICKIISYDSLYRDEKVVQAWAPEALVLDEAQRVKNWDTRAARSVKRLDTRFALVLTGTPMENRLEELLSLVQVVDRHRLGPTWRFLHQHQLRDEAGRVVGYRQFDQFSQTLAPIMIRRRKAEVLQQLPARRDQDLLLPLSAKQREWHDEYAANVARLTHKWRRHGFLSDGDQKRLRAWLQKMRQICVSLRLVDPNVPASEQDGHKIPELLLWLQERLSDPDNKVVVFSSWLGTQELLAEGLAEQGIECVRFNGSVEAKRRDQLVQRFRSDPACRVFLSTDAGGVGLNLQDAAALIVNVDPPWNPAVLEQRIGRVHRMGQTRPVEVLNLISENSIEERIRHLLRFKQAAFDGALDQGASEVVLSGGRLREFMESLEQIVDAPAPQDEGDQVVDSLARGSLPGALSGADVAEMAEGPHAEAGGSDGSRSDQRASSDSAPVPIAPGDVAAAVDAGGAGETDGAGDTDAAGMHAVPSATADPLAQALAPLLQAAGTWLGRIAASVAAPEGSDLVVTDPRSGERKLQLPLPDPALLRQLADLSALLQGQSER
jgi:superfamily II DNA or RNA helicase